MSNFVFSRRAMQRAIDNLSNILRLEDIQSIVDRLNRVNDKRLPAMWELMILDALTNAGELRHEIKLANGRRPDFELTVRSATGLPAVIVGDVTTVSDISLHEQNPIKYLSSELRRVAEKLGLSPGHLSYDARGGRDGVFGDGKMSLFLPPKKEIPRFIKEEVTPWLRQLTAAPSVDDKFEYAKGRAKLTLRYHPNSAGGGGGGYTSYDVAASRSKNPLFSALKGKKDQLKAAPLDALRLVIVCDGDCSLLRRGGRRSSTPETFTARQVAEDFLRQNSSIDAVLLVTIDEGRQIFVPDVSHSIRSDLVVAGEADRSERLSLGAIDLLIDRLNCALGSMPKPMRAAYTAASLCLRSKFGSDKLGAYSMQGDNITISSRALLRLLSGEISTEDFIAAHGWGESGYANPFLQRARAGQPISGVQVEEGGDRDDDHLQFSFGFPDPAASAFRVLAPKTAE